MTRTTPTLDEQLTDMYMEIAKAFYFEGSDPETERTEYAPKFVNEIKQAVYAALVEQMPKKRTLTEPVTKRAVKEGDSVGIDLDADPKGSMVFIQDNGFNNAIDQTLSVLSAVLGIEEE